MHYELSKELTDSLREELNHYMDCRLGIACKRCQKLINDMLALKVIPHD